MSKELTSFFVELSANPLLMEKFESNPVAAVKEFGLSAGERALVLSRDLDTLTSQLQANGPVGGGGPTSGSRPTKPVPKKKTAKKKATKKK